MIEGLKPYTAYKDTGVSWLAKLPEHWTTTRLRRVTQCLDGKRIPLNGTEREKRQGPYPYWGANRVIDYVDQWLFDEELVLLGEDGAPFFEPTRDVAFFVRGKVWVNNHAHVLRPKNVLSKYLTHALNCVDYREFIDGATRDKLTQQAMKDIQVPSPSEVEQFAIVRFLDHADRRIRRHIRAKQKLIKLLDEQKQAIIQHAVTCGLDPNVHFKPSGAEWLGEVPENWDVYPAKRLYHEIDDRSVSGNEEQLSVSHITGVTPRSQKNVTMFKAESYVGHKICRRDDLVVNTMWAWMGALGVADQTGIVSPSYAVYRPLRSSRLRPEYAGLLLRTLIYIAEFVRRSTGIRSSRLRLYPEQFLRIPILCPPEKEQAAVLAYVTEATRELSGAIERTVREMDIIREYRASLISTIVTGKLDVQQAAMRLPEEPPEVEPLDELEDLPEDEGAADDGELEAADAA